MTHSFSADTPGTSDLYQLTTRVHRHIGFQKIRLGAMLCVLEESGEWKGRTGAHSFRGFLIEEGIHPQAARQYMKIARKFVLELQTSTQDLHAMSRASMRVLCAAADVATPDNQSDLIDIIVSLPKAEALDEIRSRYAMSGDERAQGGSVSKPVGKILSEVGELTQLQRAELFSKLNMSSPSARVSNASS